MHPPLFEICSNDTSVQALLGNGPTLRVYPFGEALQKDRLPYVTWAIGGGTPENYLGQVPDTDAFTTHIDVVAATAASAREVTETLLAAIEPFAHVVSWDGEFRDRDTRAYRVAFTVDWIESR